MSIFFLIIFTIAIFGNVIASFSRKNILSRLLYILLLFTMLIIAASQTWNNDYVAYNYYYNNSGLRNLEGVESGFVIFAKLSRDILRLSYPQFRCMFFILMLGIVGIYIWRLSERPNFVLLLYGILFLSVNITQIRSGMTEAFVIAAIYYLKEKRIVKYVLCIFLGTSFHVAALFFGVYILLYYEKTKKWLVTHKNAIIVSSITALIAFRIIGSLIPAVVQILNQIGGDDYRTSVQFVGYEGNHYLKYLPIPFIMIVLFRCIERTDENSLKVEFFELIAYLSLYIYPFFTINRQLSRISRTTVILSIIIFVEYLFEKNRKKAVFSFLFVLFWGFSYYALSAYTTCLEPLLKYSILSGIIF